MSAAIAPFDLPPLRVMTTDEAFEHALKVCGAERESSFAMHLKASRTPAEFFSREGFAYDAFGQLAVCVYFVSRAGIAVMTHGEDR